MQHVAMGQIQTWNDLTEFATTAAFLCLAQIGYFTGQNVSRRSARSLLTAPRLPTDGTMPSE